MLCIASSGITPQKVDAISPRSSLAELPADSQMIGHFHAHRAQFLEVVRHYGADKRAAGAMLGAQQLGDTSKYKDLLHGIGIRRLSYDGAAWLPDPYSLETARQLKGINPFTEHAYQGLFLEPLGSEYRKITPRVRGTVWKEYFYVPAVPRVAEGKLWWPRSSYDEQTHRSARVMPTLDEYPSTWIRGPSDERLSECVFRQFEPQWFLKMCIHM